MRIISAAMAIVAIAVATPTVAATAVNASQAGLTSLGSFAGGTYQITAAGLIDLIGPPGSGFTMRPDGVPDTPVTDPSYLYFNPRLGGRRWQFRQCRFGIQDRLTGRQPCRQSGRQRLVRHRFRHLRDLGGAEHRLCGGQRYVPSQQCRGVHCQCIGCAGTCILGVAHRRLWPDRRCVAASAGNRTGRLIASLSSN